MSEHNETLADIVAEMRYGAIPKHRTDHELLALYVDRIEAAARREQSQSWHHREMEELVLRHEKELADARMSSGNAAAMREALSDACYAMFNFLKAQNGGYEEMANALDKAKAALNKPLRNCDVGDAADWEKRFGEECDKGHICSDCPVRHAKTRMAIELDKGARCEFVWAQMPYEEGGAA